MKIVIDARFLRRSTGGIGRYTQALIRELAEIDQENTYCLLITEADKDDWEELKKNSKLDNERWRAEVIDIPHYSIAEQTQLLPILDKLQPDLVHFTNFNHPIRYTKPFVITIHDLTILNFPVGKKQKSIIGQWALRATMTHAVNAAKSVITVSETSKEDLIKQFKADPKRLVVTYEGVDPQYQPVNLPQRGRVQTQLKEKYGITPPYFLFVSQWRPHKGILTLIEAYDFFRKNQPKLHPQLVITGKPNQDFPEIPKRIEESSFAKDIIRPGFVDEEDLPKLYQAAEAFVFPSQYEGFGLTPVEAMACGVPVLASDASCLPEILGEGAYLIDPKDPLAWSRAFTEVLSSRTLWQQLRTNGFTQARKYSWRKMAEETFAAYQNALK